jgi:hypothetical protein
LTREALRESLLAGEVAGWIGTQLHDVQRKIRMLVAGDTSTAFGLGDLLPTTAEEVMGGLRELADWDFVSEEGSRGRSYVSPDAVVEQVERVAERLHLACERGERVFFGTGHPTGPLELWGRLATEMAERGAKILRVNEGDPFEGYVGGSQIRYVCDVACVSMAGDLVHTHSARPMEFLLSHGLDPEFVIGDHGFAGAALARGIDAVAMIDTNDPGLLLACARRLPVWPVLCDDNRPAAAYHELFRFIRDRL